MSTKEQKIHGRKAKLPVLCFLNLSAHFRVWVRVWVRQLPHILTRTVFNIFATKKHRKPKLSMLFGAAGRIRTADLILTKDALYLLSYSSILATKKGLEPSTSSVTGWRSNQLNYLALSRSRELKLAYYSKCGGKCQHPFPDFLAKISVPGGRQVCRPAFLTAPALRTTSRTAPSCR